MSQYLGQVVVGVDPDSKEHGVAVYRNGKLTALRMMATVDLVISLANELVKPVVSIENVLVQNFVYSRNAKARKAAHAKVGLSVGRCQQAQVELQRWLDYYQIPYVLHRPQAGNWAKNKNQFEKVTGWTGRSNADTRSAAYFGFLAVGGRNGRSD